MKRNFQILFAFVASVIVFSCNSSGSSDNKNVDTTTSPNKKDTSSAASAENEADITQNCEYYITESDGRAMKDNFSKIYPSLANTTIDKLTTEFWIDSCELSSLIDFFNTNGAKCDGARFCFINDKNSGLAIVPTTPTATQNSNKKHDDRPDLLIKNKCNGNSVYFNISDYKNKSDKFGGTFRRESNPGNHTTADLDSLSSSVWFSKCVLLKLARLVTDKTNNLNGITAFCAAHLRIELNASILGQIYSNQSSLIFVPTYGPSHLPNWQIVNPNPAISKSDYENKSGAFNHGELCPKICD